VPDDISEKGGKAKHCSFYHWKEKHCFLEDVITVRQENPLYECGSTWIRIQVPEKVKTHAQKSLAGVAGGRSYHSTHFASSQLRLSAFFFFFFLSG
jgi:hypothetical protein